MPGQFAFSCDRLHTSWHDNGVHAGFNNSKNLVRELEESKAPAPEADSTSETPRTDAIDSDRADAGSIGAYFMMRDLAWKLERELAQAKKRLIDAEEILGELASGYWRQTLNNIDDRPTRPDWPMGELIQLYWEKQNQGKQP